MALKTFLLQLSMKCLSVWNNYVYFYTIYSNEYHFLPKYISTFKFDFEELFLKKVITNSNLISPQK